MRRMIPLLLFCLALAAVAIGQSHQSAALMEKAVDSPSGKEGTLVVLVTWGDLNNTPATDVWIEAHGFVPMYHSERSFVLKLSQAGQYEASLPPAVYDVFVSEGTSLPRCNRVLIKSGEKAYWTLKLEVDNVYTEK